MSAVGIIAEFDPFHDGHAYLIREARKLTGADHVVVAMSGDFVERGEPAVFDKFERARAAVRGGADVVFELPTAYATSGAKIFSEAGVRLLSATGVVDSICFGSECGDIETLCRASELLDNESEEFKTALLKYQKEGDSYPKAREKALRDMGVSEELVKLMREPNNILGIHYISAISNYCNGIKPYTIKRKGAGYHDRNTTGEGFKSASEIRAGILNKELINYGSYPICADDFSQVLFARLLSLTPEQLTRFADVTEPLAMAAMKHREKSMSFSELVSKVKSKNNLYTSVSRALLHVVLDMKEEIRPEAGELRIPYLRLLAFKESSSGLLRSMRDNTVCPLITKPADAPCRDDELFKLDIRAASLYNGAVLAKYGVRMEEDMKRGPVIVR
ncbi:MAG: nucleotidyltransferase family protein [Lachnospiraceae bacterium]|nr:nucleotidyltransferase family protein [Lachnospiraceae bacterium]